MSEASPTSSTIRQHIVFVGRVQGVGFRATARHTARGFAVTGWVRNQEDGSVEMEIQGSPAEVASCLARLRASMHDCIERESTMNFQPVPHESEFEIRH